MRAHKPCPPQDTTTMTEQERNISPTKDVAKLVSLLTAKNVAVHCPSKLMDSHESRVAAVLRVINFPVEPLPPLPGGFKLYGGKCRMGNWRILCRRLRSLTVSPRSRGSGGGPKGGYRALGESAALRPVASRGDRTSRGSGIWRCSESSISQWNPSHHCLAVLNCMVANAGWETGGFYAGGFGA